MTNKPNDVRVSRELLEKISAMQWSGPERIECRVALKSLLDAKPCQHEFIYYGTSELPRRCRHCDAEELRAILAQPADQQGEPAAWANGEHLLLCSRSRLDVGHTNPIYHELPRNIAGSALKTEYCDTPLYRHAQPATVKVVLPERMKTRPFQTVDRGSPSYVSAYNACLDEVAKLNTPQ